MIGEHIICIEYCWNIATYNEQEKQYRKNNNVVKLCEYDTLVVEYYLYGKFKKV